ncbi:hypothetical protein H0H92_008456 [Tricholoma furcatifolium]|nr:hypothetical protein H0H92_008456 [Tricholoma furcatifolium]
MPVPFDVENFVVYGLTKAENGELLEIEVFWRKHYQLFKEHGYTLQPRYQPNWIPSWWNTSKKWSKCEDGTANLGKLLDATRDEDGSIVMIKRIDPRKFAEEIHPPCDPFPVDVYCLGNCIRQRFVYGWKFHQPKKGFEFIRDLVDDMTDPDPSKRPTMKEASSRLNVIIEGLDENKLRSPFLKAHEWMTLRQFIVHWTKQYIRKARGIPAIPRA